MGSESNGLRRDIQGLSGKIAILNVCLHSKQVAFMGCMGDIWYGVSDHRHFGPLGKPHLFDSIYPSYFLGLPMVVGKVLNEKIEPILKNVYIL